MRDGSSLEVVLPIVLLVAVGLAGCTGIPSGSSGPAEDPSDDDPATNTTPATNGTGDGDTDEDDEDTDDGTTERRTFETSGSSENATGGHRAPLPTPARDGCEPGADPDEPPATTVRSHTFHVPQPVDPTVLEDATVRQLDVAFDVTLSTSAPAADLDLCVYGPGGDVRANLTGADPQETEQTADFDLTDPADWDGWEARVLSRAAAPQPTTYSIAFEVAWNVSLRVDGPVGAGHGEVHTVTIGEETSGTEADYSPANLTIPVRDGVKWENADSLDTPHTATTLDDAPASFDTGTLEAGETSNVTWLDEPGVYGYYCTIHGEDNMHAQIVVEG